MKSSPSSSESRLLRMSPLMKPSSGQSARQSRLFIHSEQAFYGPCSMLSSVRIASSVATSMPLSAPMYSLWLSAIHRLFVSMGSVRKSCFTSLFFSHTMSMCDCRTTVFLFSMPEWPASLSRRFRLVYFCFQLMCFSPNAFK